MFKKFIFLAVIFMLFVTNYKIQIVDVHEARAKQNIKLILPTANKPLSFIPKEDFSKTFILNNDINVENFENFIKYRNNRIPPWIVTRIVEVIFKWSKFFNVNPLLVLGVMGNESAYNRLAKGPAKEAGLMQINPIWWVNNKDNKYDLIKMKFVRNLKELTYIGKNVKSGTFIMSIIKDKCEKLRYRLQIKKYGFYTTNKCMIIKYNGRTDLKYYYRVASVIGDYFFFIRSYEGENSLLAYNK